MKNVFQLRYYKYTDIIKKKKMSALHLCEFTQNEGNFFIQLFCFKKWTASSEFGTYCLCEQRRFRRACASAQSLQNLRCSLIQAVSQEEPSDRKPDPWPLWMAWHAQLKFVMTECSKTQIRLTGLKCHLLTVLCTKNKFIFCKVKHTATAAIASTAW